MAGTSVKKLVFIEVTDCQSAMLMETKSFTFFCVFCKYFCSIAVFLLRPCKTIWVYMHSTSTTDLLQIANQPTDTRMHFNKTS